jgi:hypothetical protein
MEEHVMNELEALGGGMLGGPTAKAEGLVGGVGDAPEEGAAPAAGVYEGLDAN